MSKRSTLGTAATALGSASVSLVGDGVSPSQTFLGDRFGETLPLPRPRLTTPL